MEVNLHSIERDSKACGLRAICRGRIRISLYFDVRISESM